MNHILFRIFLTVCLFLPASVAVFGQNASKNEAAVVKALQIICKAYETKDTSVLLEYMTGDFTLTASDGSITTRDDEINELKSGKVTYRVFENVDMKVRFHGKTAVVTGRTIVKGEYEKSPIDAEFQFTDTLVFKNGRWRIAASHASRLRPKS